MSNSQPVSTDPLWDLYEADLNAAKTTLHDNLKKAALWGNIHRAAETNPTIKDALDRCVVLYILSRKGDKHGI